MSKNMRTNTKNKCKLRYEGGKITQTIIGLTNNEHLYKIVHSRNGET